MTDEDQLENELMPNSSEAIPGLWEPETDEAEEREAVQENRAIATAIPLMEELMDWFTEQIQVCDSVAQVRQTVTQYKVTTEEALNAHDIVRELLTSKKESLRARYDAFMEGRETEGEK